MRWFRRDRKRLLTLIVSLLMLSNVLFGYYILEYSTGNKEVDEHVLENEVLDVSRSQYNQIAVMTTEQVFLFTPQGLLPVAIDGAPMDMEMGDITGTLAVLNDNGTVYYFRSGSTTPLFHTVLNGSARLVGITEQYATPSYIPENIAVFLENESGDHLVLLSIEEEGNVSWEHTFSYQVTAYNDAPNGRYISIGLENGSVYVFSKSNNVPREILQIGSVPMEIDMTMSGTGLGVLYGEGKKMGLYTFDSQPPLWDYDLISEGSGLVVQREGGSAFVSMGNKILKVERGELVSVTDVESLVTYSAPVVSDWVFASTPDEIIAFRGERSGAMWSSDIETGASGIVTDAGGNLVIFWVDNTLGLIENDDAIAGSSTLWAVFGFLIISQSVALPVLSWWKRIYEKRKEIGYLLLAGALVGVTISGVFPNAEAVAWYGSTEAVMALAAALCALTSVISWRADAGLANLAVGFTMGVLLAIPMALIGHFTLSVVGYQFADTAFHSIVNTMVTGLEMGVAGGVVGLIANRLLR